jgi:proteasome activator subunit 4
MIDSTFSERGWHWTGKLVEKSVSCLTSIHFAEMSILEERDSEGTPSLVRV